MLLTGSQISTFVSSAVVCTFTSILFLSGYVLQQRTVRDMQEILHPKPTPTPVSEIEVQVPAISDRKQQILAATGQQPVNWKKVAYARTVHDFGDVCEAVMLFSELTRQRSPAQKVLMYPEDWDDRGREDGHGSRAAETAMRLLAKAKREFKAALVPLRGGETSQERQADSDLANLLALASFERVMYLQPRGLVLDAEILDSLFGMPLNSSVVAIDGDRAWPFQSLLVQPSQTLSRRSGAVRESLAAPLLDTPVLSDVLLQTSSLRTAPETLFEDFDGSDFFDYTAYARFSDAEIPGPEFYLPSGTFTSLQPQSAEHRTAWRALYDRYRLERMSVCGLDLQPIPT